MSRDKEHNPDPNENAARIVAESTGEAESPPHDLEAAWEAWSKSIQNVDERVRTLLRAAFEAGYEAASEPDAAALGRRGGQKGGKARAEKLSAGRRSEIAKNAAAKRWAKESDG